MTSIRLPIETVANLCDHQIALLRLRALDDKKGTITSDCNGLAITQQKPVRSATSHFRLGEENELIGHSNSLVQVVLLIASIDALENQEGK